MAVLATFQNISGRMQLAYFNFLRARHAYRHSGYKLRSAAHYASNQRRITAGSASLFACAAFA
jgi:hypothetical protein